MAAAGRPPCKYRKHITKLIPNSKDQKEGGCKLHHILPTKSNPSLCCPGAVFGALVQCCCCTGAVFWSSYNPYDQVQPFGLVHRCSVWSSYHLYDRPGNYNKKSISQKHIYIYIYIYVFCFFVYLPSVHIDAASDDQ